MVILGLIMLFVCLEVIRVTNSNKEKIRYCLFVCVSIGTRVYSVKNVLADSIYYISYTVNTIYGNRYTLTVKLYSMYIPLAISKSISIYIKY